jgi:V/A-type H+-transporting ATPase subunit I
MAVRPVKKVTLVALKESREALVSQMQRFGMLDITDLTARPEELPEGLEIPDAGTDDALSRYAADLERLDQAIRLIAANEQAGKSFLAVPPAATEEELERVATTGREEIMARVDEALSLYRQIADIRARVARIDQRLEQLAPWLSLNIPVEDLRDTREAAVLAGTIPAAEWPAFIDDIREMNTLDLEEVSSDRESIRILALCHRLENLTLTRALTRAGFVRAEFQDEKGRPSDIAAGYEQTRRECTERIENLGRQIAAMTDALPGMRRLYDALALLRDRREAQLRFGDTANVFYVSGWIPARDEDAFRRAMLSVTGAVEMHFRDPSPGESAPTLIENNPVVEPFEAITEMYSTPQRTEMDPNAAMAPFFFAFFGMMVSDAGYGVLIAIAGSIMYWLMRRKGTKAKLVMVVALGGISTLIWGALFGGWFGFTFHTLWFNPLEEPLTMLVVCFALGLIQIVAGILLKTVAELRAGNIADAIFGNLCWVLLFAGVLLLAAPMLGEGAAFAAMATAGKIISLASVAGIVLGKAGMSFAAKWRERKKKSLFSAVGTGIGSLLGGVMALYNVTGYFSDLLSYSRLFALGLATGVVGMVINSIVSMLVSGTGFMAVAGWIFGIVVFVGGHIFNIVVNALGAYVHASRLQYIEYFGKFLEGGGTPFRPFRIKTRYHLLKPSSELSDNMKEA